MCWIWICCLPCQRMLFKSGNEGSKCVGGRGEQYMPGPTSTIIVDPVVSSNPSSTLSAAVLSLRSATSTRRSPDSLPESLALVATHRASFSMFTWMARCCARSRDAAQGRVSQQANQSGLDQARRAWCLTKQTVRSGEPQRRPGPGVYACRVQISDGFGIEVVVPKSRYLATSSGILLSEVYIVTWSRMMHGLRHGHRRGTLCFK